MPANSFVPEQQEKGSRKDQVEGTDPGAEKAQPIRRSQAKPIALAIFQYLINIMINVPTQ